MNLVIIPAGINKRLVRLYVLSIQQDKIKNYQECIIKNAHDNM